MFDDTRSKKLIIVAHCILNQNSISDGTADYPGQFTELVDMIMPHQIGFIQLPCPELTCLGLDRKDRQGVTRPLLQENTRIRALMSREANVELLRQKAEEIVTEVQEYASHGFEILGLIGVNRSPSCGVETTTKCDTEVSGAGVFMELISDACRRKGQTIRMIGVKTSEREASMKKLRQLIENADAI